MAKRIPKMEIPEYIRSMLEPHKILTGAKKPKTKKGIEITYIPKHARPETTAIEAIGQVAATWAILESVIQILLNRLALTAFYPARCLTADLSMDNRLRALKTLITLHRERYFEEIVGEPTLKVISDLLPDVARLKDKRNRIVHTVWLHGGPGKIYMLRSRTLSSAALKKAEDQEMTTEQINAVAAEIEKVANGLFVLAQLVPEADEASLSKSLARARHRLRSETPTRPTTPRSPSQE